MPLRSINYLATECGVARETVRKKVDKLPFKMDGQGKCAAKLYDSVVALPAILYPGSVDGGDDNAISEAEARRRLTIAKEKQVRLEIEVLAKERPKLKEVLEIFSECFGDVAGIIRGSALEHDRKDDILRRLQDAMTSLETRAMSQEVSREPTAQLETADAD